MRKRLFLLSLILVLTGCSKVTEPTKGEESTEPLDRIEAEEPKDTEAPADKAQQEADSKQIQEWLDNPNKVFSANSRETELSREEWNRLLTTWSDLQKEDPVLIREQGNMADLLSFSIEEEEHDIRIVRDKNNRYVSLDGVEYPFTDSIAQIFEEYCEERPAAVSTHRNPSEELRGLSVVCPEPKNPEEYLQTAREVVKPWLDSLWGRTDEYRLPSYTFTDKLAENREFHGDGMVNGGREFVCYVAFETPKEEEDTVFYAEGTYDTFYHYYFGPGILARFRWEDGVCTLVDYDEAFAMLTSDRLKDGLYGIGEEETQYKTFYDFLNDRENVNTWLGQGYRSRLCSYRVSHNVMMLANGKVIFMDIGDSSQPKINGDMVTTDMHQYYYDAEGDEKYSSPVDFIDGQGAVVMTYREGFPVIYDDYNHDGNPDFAIRISSDEYGSTYDVRCMDVNGTPWEDGTEVYIYGTFEESIRLQVYNGNSVYIPTKGSDGEVAFTEHALLMDKSNATHPVVTDVPLEDYRMYSQRFYLPEERRCYTEDDATMICYFWNNTGKDITLQKEYEIQRKKGDTWETVAEGTLEEAMVSAYGNAELTFDISGIPSQEMALYRVKAYAEDMPVYGGFYYGTEGNASLEITSGEFPDYTMSLDFDLTNSGISVAYLSSATLYYGEKKLHDVSLDQVKRIVGGETATLEVYYWQVGGAFPVGEYRLEVVADGTTYEGTAKVVPVPKENRYYFPEKVEASKNLTKISLSLTNQIWSKEDVVIERVGMVQVLKGDSWCNTTFSCDDIEDLPVPFGESVELDLVEDKMTKMRLEILYEEFQKGAYDYLEVEEYEQWKSMTFDEFAKELLQMGCPEQGDLCRVEIHRPDKEASDMEYVYFEMP